MFKKFLKGIGVIFIAIIMATVSTKKGTDSTNVATSNNNTTKKEEVKKETKSETKKEQTKVNYDNFLKVNMGAKYEEVVAILGEGKEMSSSDIGGVKTAMYTWHGSGISNMNATFSGGKVSMKAQFNLK